MVQGPLEPGMLTTKCSMSHFCFSVAFLRSTKQQPEDLNHKSQHARVWVEQSCSNFLVSTVHLTRRAGEVLHNSMQQDNSPTGTHKHSHQQQCKPTVLQKSPDFSVTWPTTLQNFDKIRLEPTTSFVSLLLHVSDFRVIMLCPHISLYFCSHDDKATGLCTCDLSVMIYVRKFLPSAS
jgi:hypothetical protein